MLDFQRNAVHAGIYLALERDFDGAELPGPAPVADLLRPRNALAVG